MDFIEKVEEVMGIKAVDEAGEVNRIKTDQESYQNDTITATDDTNTVVTPEVTAEENVEPLEPTLGAHKSPHDYRDVPMSHVATASPLPPSLILDITSLPVWNQKKIGACTGHAGAKYRQYLLSLDTKQIFPLSARFIYSLAKCQDGVADQGTFPRLIAQNIQNFGIATEATCPNETDLDHETYVYNRVQANIPADAFTDAAPFKIGGYAFPNVKDPSQLKQAISQFNGAMLLVQVGQEWWTNAAGVSSWAPADVVPLRAPKNVVGGHEVFLYGYEDVIENGATRTKFYIFNSWSVQWGLSGKAWFYYDEYSPFIEEAITFVDLPANLLQNLSQLPSKAVFKHTFNHDINLNDSGDEVVALQAALMLDGDFDQTLYKSLLLDQAGSQLGMYGDITRRAVLAFQTKYQVAPNSVLGPLAGKTVGPATRAKLNSLFS